MRVQNHHIINQTLFDAVLARTGLNLNTSALNRINLPDTREAGQRLGLPFHRGPHTGTGYSNYVTMQVRAILDLPLDQAGKAAAIEQEDGNLMFPIRVQLSQDYLMVNGAKRRLAPGLAVTAEVKTGKRRIIDFLLSPLAKRVEEAGRER